MLHIILLILKIIGIILLVILGILLCAILSALFVPVRYKIRLSREEGEGKPPFEASVKITWLLHFVNILIRYPCEVIVRVRLSVIPILELPDKKQKDEKAAAKKSKKKENEQKPDNADEKPQKAEHTDAETADNAAERRNTAAETKAAPASGDDDSYHAFESDFMIGDASDLSAPDKGAQETAAGEETEGLLSDGDSPAMDEKEDFAEPSSSGKKPAFTDKIKEWIHKIRQLFAKIKALFENIQYTIRTFCDKIKSTLDNIQYYREVLESEPFRQSFNLCKRELGAIVKSLKPDKLEADLVVGMADPATTGQILAAYGMLYPLLGQHVRVVGNFEVEQTYAEGTLFIRGKIRAFTFLKAAIKIYFNKDIKKLVKLLKKEAV